MKRFYHFFVIVAVVILAANINCYGQEVYGKLFKGSVANQKYGPVLDSVVMPLKNFQTLLNETDKYIMFKIVNNSVIILNQDRKVLYPENATVKPEEVFSMYSKSVVEDLISVGDADSVYFQQRKDVLSITIGNITMEVAAFCPPLCPGP